MTKLCLYKKSIKNFHGSFYKWLKDLTLWGALLLILLTFLCSCRLDAEEHFLLHTEHTSFFLGSPKMKIKYHHDLNENMRRSISYNVSMWYIISKQVFHLVNLELKIFSVIVISIKLDLNPFFLNLKNIQHDILLSTYIKWAFHLSINYWTFKREKAHLHENF